jgi:hypothetical protein
MGHPWGWLQITKGERGVTAVVVALLMVLFVGVAALAIDIAHLFLVRNELRNATDAGCLAGARFLYNEDGTVNEGANLIAYNAAIANKSAGAPVEVYWDGGNSGDVERGHWSFTTRSFTPNDSTEPVPLWDVSGEDLDLNPDFINALRVSARRQASPVSSFFARIFGYEHFILSTEAIAFIGFAGTMTPSEGNQPIAICRESLLINEQYSCKIGRAISIGREVSIEETGGWTDFNQVDACNGGTNGTAVTSLVCGDGNPEPILLGQPITTNPGDIPSAFTRLRQCWESATGRSRPWIITLPVVECPGNRIDTCQRIVGAVTINVVWITGEAQDPTYADAPWVMENPRTGTTWSSSNPDGQIRWASFVQDFNLQRLDGTAPPYREKMLYFLPDCDPHKPAGRTGGEDFGILAKIPVLVK